MGTRVGGCEKREGDASGVLWDGMARASPVEKREHLVYGARAADVPRHCVSAANIWRLTFYRILHYPLLLCPPWHTLWVREGENVR